MNQHSHIAIVGAGASGLTAAIFAASAARASGRSARIILLDSARTIGTKILISGGGRCNVTHETIRPNDYAGSINIVRNVLSTFTQCQTVDWFASLGVALKQEATGKLFPNTDKARTVLDALLRACHDLGVEILPEHRITSLVPPASTDEAFTLQQTNGMCFADCVIWATGGKSLPRTGSDGSGWTILQSLGHTVTPTAPALVPLVLSNTFFHASLSGLASQVQLTTSVDRRPVDRRTGSLLWTHFGISGPVVMDASRYFTLARQAGQAVEIFCNLMPDETAGTLEAALVQKTTAKPKSTLATVLGEKLPARLAEAVLRHIGIDPAITLSHLSRPIRRALVQGLTQLPLPVTEDRGWNYAEVTAGGVPLSEIDPRSMESRKVPRLYLAGELLDVDGRIGGFNFQWAWSTGHLAGSAAGRSISDRA